MCSTPDAGPHLVELQHIQQVKQLSVLLAVLQLTVVLLQAVEGQLGLVVHKHLHGLQTQCAQTWHESRITARKTKVRHEANLLPEHSTLHIYTIWVMF